MASIKELELKIEELQAEIVEKDSTIEALVAENKKLKEAKPSISKSDENLTKKVNGVSVEILAKAIKKDGLYLVFQEKDIEKYEKLGKTKLATDADIEALVAEKTSIIKILK